MTRPLFDRIAILGLGLLGASLALAVRRGGLAGEIAGYARSQETRDRVRELGFCDGVSETAVDAVKGADLVVLCAPVGAFGALAEAIGPHLRDDCIVTDVGSVKSAVVRDVSPHIPDGVHFIPGHPIAGTEQSGPDAGFAELFDGRWCILTPLGASQDDISRAADRAEVERLASFWQGCGSNVDFMDPHHHDLVLAITSHLPHLIAYNIVGTANELETVTQSDVIKYSAGGFRDFTRIAASDPTMWRDIFLNNREAVLEMLGRFTEDLSALQRAIRWGDGDALFNLFSHTRDIRRSIIDAGQDSAVPDFGRHVTPGHDKES
jgi:cyclohexadieny/prephenate dehydrogenase